MTIMSDREIKRALMDGEIQITPYPWTRQMQPASVDVHLGQDIRVPAVRFAGTMIDTENPSQNPPPSKLFVPAVPDFFYILNPQRFVLGSLMEKLRISDRIVARLEGCSSLGRYGLMIHSTAGFVDPGWDGKLTLELFNAAPWPIKLTAGMRIGQLAFYRLGKRASRQYGDKALGSRYQNQTGTQPPMPRVLP